MNRHFSWKMLDLQAETNFVFPKIVISNSFFIYFVVSMNSSKVITRFKSSTYTTIISNLVCDFLIKMHEHIRLFKHHFL